MKNDDINETNNAVDDREQSRKNESEIINQKKKSKVTDKNIASSSSNQVTEINAISQEDLSSPRRN